MRLFSLVIALTAFAFVFGACSVLGGGGGESITGDPERLLVLGGGSFTEEEFRRAVAFSFADEYSSGTLCEETVGLSPEAAADVISGIQANDGTNIEQEAVPEDRIRAAEIILEECARLG